ncbi:MAG: hypothetical protein IKY70_02780 [Bacteroidales bacterium]|nr:hypothetical protein [Bacteroidales bacterium]
MLYIAVFPFVLIILPLQTNKFLSIIMAFILGITVDIFTDGIPGLNAAATTAIAFFKTPVLKLLLSKNNLESTQETTEYTLGFAKFSLYILLLYMIFFIFYMGLDSFGFYSFGYSTLRFLINVVANSIIAILFGKALAKQLFLK